MKILFIGCKQFGYLLDYYYYCCNCPKDIKITYMGIDIGRPKITTSNTNTLVLDVKRKNSSYISKIFAHLMFFIQTFYHILFKKYDVIFVNSHQFSFIWGILAYCKRVPIVLDIRTGSVNSNRSKRIRNNRKLLFNSRFFSNVSIISLNLAKYLKIPEKKTYLLPLGANIQPGDHELNWDQLRLFYIGTLSGRDLYKTIQGLNIFHKNFPEIKFSYDIIGSGDGNELSELKKIIYSLDLQDNVILHGYIHHSCIGDFWNNSNVGVSFVPINEQYNFQPPTKTFEYLGAGMPVIATATMENQLIIHNENGVLCQDTENSFAEALEILWNNRNFYDSNKIKVSFEDNTWIKITNNLFKYLSSIAYRQR